MPPQDTITLSHIGHLCTNFPFCSILIGITFLASTSATLYFVVPGTAFMGICIIFMTEFRGSSGTCSHICLIIFFKNAIEGFSLTSLSILSMAERFNFAALRICCSAIYKEPNCSFSSTVSCSFILSSLLAFFDGLGVLHSSACYLSSLTLPKIPNRSATS